MLNSFPLTVPQPVVLHGVVVTQGQGPALGVIEPHTIGLGPMIQPVQVLHMQHEGTWYDLLHDTASHFQLQVHLDTPS